MDMYIYEYADIHIYGFADIFSSLLTTTNPGRVIVRARNNTTETALENGHECG